MATQTAFVTWFTDQYLNWQKRAGKRQSVGEFAAWLGFPNSTVSNWLNGNRVPSEDVLPRLAGKLGPELYDILSHPRPDRRLDAIIRNWGKLSEAAREELFIFYEKLNVQWERPKLGRELRDDEESGGE